MGRRAARAGSASAAACSASSSAARPRHGARTIRLETNGALTEAIGLYRSSGYEDVEPFNDEPYAAPLVREARCSRGRSGYQRELRPRRLV